MTLKTLTPRLALNKAFLKVKPNRSDIENFKACMIELLDQINEKESEEHHKNIISKFLDKTYYAGSNYINTKGRNDLVIHTDKNAKSPVGVIIETKKPTNKSEMVRRDHLNSKAFHELVLYYMRERVSGNNLEVKHLIITNIYEWFIFDVNIFEKAFAQNKHFERQFSDFEEKRLAGKNTDFFYKEIAEPAVEQLLGGHSQVGKELSYTYFDIRDYEKVVRNNDSQDDNKLIALFKLLSGEHLLKLPFRNDSNSLDKVFYSELLHIIGLTEIKNGGKKIIDRKSERDRNDGSILENTITQLESLDKLSRLDRPTQFGSNNNERYFNVSLELSITWINRILFLKLLEAQLLSYHKGDKGYAFLNKDKIKSYDDLNSLFFQVLAKESNERSAAVKILFANIPYLNSSLFEPSDLEQVCFPISQLQDSSVLPILSNTVLKDTSGKRRSGDLNALEYLFAFLDAYDFSSEGTEEIQEENKALISASVLGLIFEKINGYKDGSFFTPGFITMYMCRETIRHAVIQKFNIKKGWNCKSFDDLYDKIEDKKEANEIINSLKIVDPAVGSGHFLVSALNEIIAIKSDLRVLLDRTGKSLRGYHIEVSNDELAITDEDGVLFEYNPKNKESQRIQETLFHEKQTIIENCLFGVDINTNSVKICRLRLWIELLKSAYYKTEGNYSQLETLPNIDINIKCGNSLISRFPLNSDLTEALRKSKITIKAYQQSVQNYRHATSKDHRREMERLIASIKSNFRTEISNNDPKVKRLSGKRGELDKLVNQHFLFEISKLEQKEQKKVETKLREEIKKLEAEIEEIRSNKIYENAFEWRFEFPEVLDSEGNYTGFDIAIGNPPYVDIKALKETEVDYIFKRFPSSNNRVNLFSSFVEFSQELIIDGGYLTQIVPTAIATQSSYKALRNNLLQKLNFLEIVRLPNETFGESVGDVKVDPMIFVSRKGRNQRQNCNVITYGGYDRIVAINPETADHSFDIDQDIWFQTNEHKISFTPADGSANVLAKISAFPKTLADLADFSLGVTPYDKYRGHTKEEIENKVFHASTKKDKTFKPLLLGNDVRYYNVGWNGQTWISYGDWLGAARHKRFFTEPRILVKQIIDWSTKRIWAAITNEELYNTQNAFNIIPKEGYRAEYLIAIINSRLMSFYHAKTFIDEHKMRFQKLLIKDCKMFPIPEVKDDVQKQFVSLVGKIQKAKEQEFDRNTSEIEREIDALVYQVYGLTESEIAEIDARYFSVS